MKEIDFSSLDRHLEDLTKNIADIHKDLQEYKVLVPKLYIELMKKKKIIDDIKDEAIKRAKKDANRADIESTAEGKSFLGSRFRYWYSKLSRIKKVV